MGNNFSVILYASNSAVYLKQTVGLLTSQMGSKDEVIIVDDGGTGQTRAIVDSLIVNDPRVRYVASEAEEGRFSSRVLGIKAAVNEWILFLDDPDEFASSALDELRGELQKRDVDILHFGMKWMDCSFGGEGVLRPEKGNCADPFPGTLNNDDIFKACFVDGHYSYLLCNMCFKAEICKKAVSQIPDVSLQSYDDALLYFAIAFYAESYYGLENRALYVRNFGKVENVKVQISLRDYEGVLASKDAYDGIRVFLANMEHEDFHEKGALAVGAKLAGICVQYARDLLAPSERALGYRAFIKTWSSLACVAFREEFKNKELALFKEPLFGASAPSRSKTRIATYYHQISGGGVEGVLSSSIRIWKKLGYEVHLFLDVEPDPKALESLGVASFSIMPALDESPESLYRREESIRQAVELYDIALVVYHAWLNKALPWDLITFKSLRASFVAYCHGSFTHLARVGDPYFASMPHTLSQADAVIALSDTDAAFWGMFNKKIFKAINPPTFDCGAIEPVKPCANGKNILWLGRVSPEKHPEYAIEAFGIVAREVPNAKLALVGSASSEEYGRKIDALVAGSPVADRIERHPWTNDQASFYSSSSLFLMTSDQEGYPLALAESKTFGLPCVMFSLPYLELVKGNCGILSAQFGDVHELAKLMIDVLTDDELCMALGRDARASVEALDGYDYAAFWAEVFLEATSGVAPAVESSSLLWSIFLEAYCVGNGMRFEELAWAHGEIKWLNGEADKKNAEISRLSLAAAEQAREIELLVSERERLSGEIEKGAKEIDYLNVQLEQRAVEVQALNQKYRNSSSWKIGRAVTWIPRKLRRLLKAFGR